ncbi:MAG: hypothetical protein HZB61_10100 [Nitrospirae bacterium]|nr:hypothetical protein [Nitrospirota bacterium]
MKKIIVVILSLLLLCAVAEAADVQVWFAGHVYTNEDLEKYRRASDKESTGTPSYINEADRDKGTVDRLVVSITEEKDQDYWCKNGETLRRNIEDAEREVIDAEENLKLIISSIANEIKLDKARDRVFQAKRDIEDTKKRLVEFEDKAYRQNIPATWYRCQYN